MHAACVLKGAGVRQLDHMWRTHYVASTRSGFRTTYQPRER